MSYCSVDRSSIIILGCKCCKLYHRLKKVYKEYLATVVEGDQKAPFSIDTTPRCWGALLLYLNCSTLPSTRTLYCQVLSKEVSSTIFKFFGMSRPGIEPRSPRRLAKSLPTEDVFTSKSDLFHKIESSIIPIQVFFLIF